MGSEEPKQSIRHEEFLERLKPVEELVSDDLHGEIDEKNETRRANERS